MKRGRSLMRKYVKILHLYEMVCSWIKAELLDRGDCTNLHRAAPSKHHNEYIYIYINIYRYMHAI